MDLLNYFIIISVTLTFLFYIGYLPILKFFGSFSHGSRKKEKIADVPTVSLILPTYNESNVIKAKLESIIGISYPREKLEVIVVDSKSTDGTADIAEEYQKNGVRVLKQEKRMGKANAVNYALTQATGEIVVLTDANAVFKPDALLKLIEKFDTNTGAVLPRLVPSGRLSYWDKIFYGLHHQYKSIESDADSVFIVFGELFAFRRSLIDHVDDNAAADDLQIAMTIRKKGYHIKYSMDVEVTEKVPSNQKEVRIQRTRRVFGIVQALVKYRNFLLNPRYSLYGLIIFPVHFFQMTLGPFLFFICLFSVLLKIVMIMLGNMLAMEIGLLIIVAVCIGLYCKISIIKKATLILCNIIATETYLVIALFNFARGKKFSVWEKIASTRDGTTL